MAQRRGGAKKPVVQEDDVDSQSGADNSHTELSMLEKDCCKQNF